MSEPGTPDPRAKYRELPATVRAADTVESVDTTADSTGDTDVNDGARPYLRSMLGPWVR